MVVLLRLLAARIVKDVATMPSHAAEIYIARAAADAAEPLADAAPRASLLVADYVLHEVRRLRMH